jgi:hypothetical protein
MTRAEAHEVVAGIIRSQAPEAHLVKWVLLADVIVPGLGPERGEGKHLVVISSDAAGLPLSTWEAYGFHWAQLNWAGPTGVIDRIVPPTGRPPEAPWS